MVGLAESSIPSWYKGNIDINNRKVLRTEYPPFKKGSTIKTEESVTVGDDGNYTNIPTVVDGDKVTAKEAIKRFKNTNRHLGNFSGAPYRPSSESYRDHGLSKALWQGKNLSKRQNQYYK